MQKKESRISPPLYDGTVLRSKLIKDLSDPTKNKFYATKKTVERAVKDIFDFKPLVSISLGEKELLQAHTNNELDHAYRHYVNLANGLLSGKVTIGEMLTGNYQIATREEAVKALSDGHVFTFSARKVGCGEFQGLGIYGSGGLDRYLNEGGLDILNDAEKIYADKNRAIRVLDVGSATAIMLFELKEKMGARVETHALSPTDEPHCKVDYSHVLTAEYLPMEFSKYFDLITSHRALEYSIFPHLALRSITRALAPGGRAILDWRARRLVELDAGDNYRNVDKKKMDAVLVESLGESYPKDAIAILEQFFAKYEKEFIDPDMQKLLAYLSDKYPVSTKSILAWCNEISKIGKQKEFEVSIRRWTYEGVWVPSTLHIKKKE